MREKIFVVVGAGLEKSLLYRNQTSLQLYVRQCAAHARSRKQSGPAETPARRALCPFTFAVVDKARELQSESRCCCRFRVIDLVAVVAFGFSPLLLLLQPFFFFFFFGSSSSGKPSLHFDLVAARVGSEEQIQQQQR